VVVVSGHSASPRLVGAIEQGLRRGGYETPQGIRASAISEPGPSLVERVAEADGLVALDNSEASQQAARLAACIGLPWQPVPVNVRLAADIRRRARGDVGCEYVPAELAEEAATWVRSSHELMTAYRSALECVCNRVDEVRHVSLRTWELAGRDRQRMSAENVGLTTVELSALLTSTTPLGTLDLARLAAVNRDFEQHPPAPDPYAALDTNELHWFREAKRVLCWSDEFAKEVLAAGVAYVAEVRDLEAAGAYCRASLGSIGAWSRIAAGL
jgi:hypothetical protein